MAEKFPLGGRSQSHDETGRPPLYIAQAGAICYRTRPNRSAQVLLVTSRRNGCWGIPKGRIEIGESSGAAAEREAMEEAGVRGQISKDAIGSFIYTKDNSYPTYYLKVHLLQVRETLADFPERQSRKLLWTPLETAVQAILNHDLRDLLLLVPNEIQLSYADGL